MTKKDAETKMNIIKFNLNDPGTINEKLISEFTRDLEQLRDTFIRLNFNKVSEENINIISNSSVFYLYSTTRMIVKWINKDDILSFISHMKLHFDFYLDEIRKDNNV